MKWWGKVIGSSVGLLGGPVGALVGATLGHWFDRREAESKAPGQEKKAKLLYYAYFFTCAAKVAKADGGISNEEIQAVEGLMEKMKLSQVVRQFAQEVFREGKTDNSPISGIFGECSSLICRNPSLGISFLRGLMEVACASGDQPSKLQYRCLLIGEESFGLPPGTIRSWLSERKSPDGVALSLSCAYSILQVKATISDQELKSAYRERMKVLHPDRMHGKNLPEELMIFAGERAAMVNHAYDVILKSRGIN